MNRSQRIRMVAAAGVGLFALFVAFVGALLVAAIFWTFPDPRDAVAGEWMTSIAAAQRIANAANAVSLGSLAVAGFCFLYVLVVWAIWFVGPSRDSHDHPA